MNYFVKVLESLKRTWVESRAPIESNIKPEIELTYEGEKLKKEVLDFYNGQLVSVITKQELNILHEKLHKANSIPNSAWNRMALAGKHAYMNTLWFIPFWNGDLNELLVD
ncbi:hypothetical protein SCRM01_147c [Synechococcus phage S-CRM01]|uniref:hypothetical protein n=1 Tax=Synechococcus phage S-CRM01 TaxID=1026955 RepID=UPI000209E3E4|nr:hypothetical protein SCRM01_147c [Synechococcus phage S-CRM01]AEC53093.1 hypothetical protein SCRM01_147c [Synechococcus phage S-CRM01]